MNVIKIDYLGIDNSVFTNIGREMLECTNQLNYKTSPSRQSEGSMENINNYESFVVPQLKVGFKLIRHDEYDKLRSLLLAKRTFILRYYDVDFNRFVYHEMYAHPDELKNFFNLGERVIGLQNFSLTFVGTLNGKDAVMGREYGVGIEGATTALDPMDFKFNKGDSLRNIAVEFPGKETQYVGWGRSVQVPEGGPYKAPASSLINKTTELVLNTNDRVNIYEDMTFTT